MTQRDWQKDMDDVSHYLKDRHSYHHAEQTLRGTPVADILQYWLQEAKRQEGLATGRGQAIIRKNREISELEARADAFEGMRDALGVFTNAETKRADAAEAREQRLKEATELLLFMFRFDPEEGQAYINFGDYEEPLETDDNSAYIAANNIFFTLYPDTPAPAAPKEGTSDESIN